MPFNVGIVSGNWSGSGNYYAGFVWHPTLSFHDPKPPITIVDGAQSATSDVATVAVSGVSVGASATGGVTVSVGVAAVAVSADDVSASATGSATVGATAAEVLVSGIDAAASATGGVTVSVGVAAVAVSADDVSASLSASQTTDAGVAVVSISADDAAATLVAPPANAGGFGWTWPLVEYSVSITTRITLDISAEIVAVVTERQLPVPYVSGDMVARCTLGLYVELHANIKQTRSADLDSLIGVTVEVSGRVSTMSLATRILDDDMVLLGMH